MSHLAKKKMCDIARLAGVSPSTVSRALNESPLVNEETREKIKVLAKQNNYVINRQAQCLRKQSSKTISVIIPVDSAPKQYISDPFFLELLGAITDRLTAANYELLLTRVNADQWYQHIMSHNYVDGIIIIGQGVIHAEIDRFVSDNSLPMVVWGEDIAGKNYVSVGTDNFLGGRLAAQSLFARGKQKIVFVGDMDNPEVRQRYQGLCAECRERDMQQIPRIVAANFTEESAKAALESLLTGGEKFDAIFAASDVIASCAVKTLSRFGFSVPQDVSVVGYDDIALASYMSPSLSTISQRIALGGSTLVDLLFKQMNGEKVSSVVLEPQLIQRDT